MIRILLMISIYLTSGCSFYTGRKCPENANEFSKCSKITIITTRKLVNPEFEAETSKGAKFKFKADSVDSELTLEQMTGALKLLSNLRKGEIQ